MASSPVFAETFDAVADELDRHLRLPLRDVVWGADAGLLDTTEFAQPALFAVEVALFAVLRRWGVQPDFVMGHSVGEILGGVRSRGVDVGGCGDVGGRAGPVDAGAAGGRGDGGGGCR